MVTMADYCDADGNIIVATRPEYNLNISSLRGAIPKAQQDNPKGVWTLFPFTQEKISRKQPTAVPEIVKVHNPIWHSKHPSVKPSDKTQEETMEQTTMSPQEKARMNSAISNPFKNKKKKAVETTTATTTTVAPATPKLGFVNNVFSKLKATHKQDIPEEKPVEPPVVEEEKQEEVVQEQVQEQPEIKPPAEPPIMAEQDFGEEDPAIVAATARANAAEPAPPQSEPEQDIPEEKPVAEEPVIDSVPVEEPKPLEEQKPAEEQQSVEEKKEPVKRSRKPAAKKVVEEKPEELTDFGTKPDPVKIEADAALLLSSYTEKSFRNEMTRILNAVRDIEIAEDMNPGVLQVRLSQICALNDEITQHSIATKMLLDNVFAKDGPVMAQASLQVEGGNETDRKKALYKILMNFPMDDTIMNIIDVKAAIGMKMTFYNQIITDLDKKRSILMSYLGSMKIEASLTR